MLNRNLILFSNTITVSSKEITLSEAVSFFQNTELNKIKECMRETNDTIKISSALSGHERNAFIVETTRKAIDESIFNRLKNNTTITKTVLLRLLNIGIKTQRAGNCYEFSLFCHALLEKQGISNEIFRISGGNHVFIVINRNQEIPAWDFRNWNKEATIIDPFFSSIYASHEIPKLLQSCLYNEESNKVIYVAFNEELHTLNNDVLETLVKDWETTIKFYNSKKESKYKIHSN